MLKRAALILAAAVLFAGPASAQQYHRDPVDASGTIASTGVYQTVFDRDPNRVGCMIQDKGSNNMSVRVNGTTIWTVIPNGTFNCETYGAIAPSKIEITGTSGDAFAASYQ